MNNTKRTWAIGATALLAGIMMAVARPGMSQDSKVNTFVQLQGTTPGVAQSGHINVTGTAKAGYFKGNGSAVTGLAAGNIASGTLSDDRLSNNIPRFSAANVFGPGGQSTTFVGPCQFKTFADLELVGTNVNVKSSEFDGAKLVAFFGNYSDDNAGRLSTYGPNGSYNAMIATPAGYPNNGWIGVKDPNSTTQASMYVNSQGKGVVTADVKNFVVPNPRNDAEDIVYASLEGPEAAAYIRGTARLVNGRARITLPMHFQDVSAQDGMTVQLTPRSFDSKGLATGVRGLNGIEVGELGGGHGNYEFDWEVKCVRRGHEDYKPVRAWDEVLPSGSKAQQWNQRIASIQAGRTNIAIHP